MNLSLIALEKILCDIPNEWRTPIAQALKLIMPCVEPTCDDIKDCQTLTSLSPFTISGDGILSVTFTDEKGRERIRTIDLTGVIQDSLLSIDPKCIMSQEDWDALSHVERLSAILSASCDCCTTSTTTTTSTSTTTTTTSPYNYYIGIRYTCEDGECMGDIAETVALELPFIATPGLYYPDANIAGDFYRILGSTSYSPSAIILDPNGLADCSEFCTTTTTTTTTTSSTTTTSTSTTTTTTLADNFFVLNEEGDLGDINNVSAVFIPTTGSFPLDDDGDQISGIHPGFASALSVQITNSVGDCNLILYKNGVPQECIDVTGNGIYTFVAVTFSASDICEIIHSIGLCGGTTTTTTTTSTSTTTTTTEATTTTTTTSTTTTTTSGVGMGNIINTTNDDTLIESVEFDLVEVDIDPDEFPIGSNDFATTEIAAGTYDVIVTITSPAGLGSVTVTGSDNVSQCQDLSTGLAGYPFSGVVVNSSQSVTILVSNDPC